MKKAILLLFSVCAMMTSVHAQTSTASQVKMTERTTLSSFEVYDLEGNKVDIFGKPYLITDYYCRWCRPCIINVKALNEAVNGIADEFSGNPALGNPQGGELRIAAIVVGVSSMDKIAAEYNYLAGIGIDALDIYFVDQGSMNDYLRDEDLPNVIPTTFYSAPDGFRIDKGCKDADFFYRQLLDMLF